MIELPRSTFYYRAVANTTGLADDQVVELIQAIQDEMPGYGYRRVTHELRRRGHEVGPTGPQRRHNIVVGEPSQRRRRILSGVDLR